MQYEELLKLLYENNNFDIYETSYCPQSFGNFNIMFCYKRRLDIQILNDRGIIEINIIHCPLLFEISIPFSFAIDYLNDNQINKSVHTFACISDMYSFFMNNVSYLDLIADKIREICKQWKKAM